MENRKKTGGGGNSGFAIVEAVVATVVLSVGLLSLATTLALSHRMIAQGQRYSTAAVLGSSVIENRIARGCTGGASGSRDQGPFVARWETVAEAAGERITVTITSPTGTGLRVDSLSALLRC